MPATIERRMRLVLNGKAADDELLRPAVEEVRARGLSLEVRVTWEAGDATKFAAEATEAGFAAVIAAGGDGTINEVVNGILSVTRTPQTAVGVVPYGTANDFATCCEIPKGNPAAALALIADAEPVPIDVGKVNGRYFVNVTSGGFGAEVTSNTPPEMKRMLGGAAYPLMAVVTAAKMSPYQARLIAPEVHREGLLLMMAVGNGRLSGGGFQVTPKALLDDGLLDVMIVHDVELANIGSVLNELLNVGAHENQHVSYDQLAEFTIESDEPLQMNLDGEPIKDTTFHFEILPRCLPFILPARAPLKHSRIPHGEP